MGIAISLTLNIRHFKGENFPLFFLLNSEMEAYSYSTLTVLEFFAFIDVGTDKQHKYKSEFPYQVCYEYN